MNLPFLLRIFYQFSGRSVRKYSYRFLLGFSTISLEGLSESISSVSFWDCVPFFSKNFQKVNLALLIGIVYQFSRRSIRKYIFRLLLRLCTIIPEALAENISFVSRWECLPFLWKIYQIVYLQFVCDLQFLQLCTNSLEYTSEGISPVSYWDCLPFLWKISQNIHPLCLIGIAYHFSGKSIRK